MKRHKPPAFDSLEHIAAAAADVIRPPDRLTVPEAAEKHRQLKNEGGGYVGDFKFDKTPYMVEPGEVLTSHEYTAMVFVGPAQSGKTELFPSWIVHSVVCDPADMMLVSPTKDAARYFSKTRLARLHRDTPIMKEFLLPGRNSQNVFDVRYKNGMFLSISHPSVAELRGKPIPRLWLTDYDAMPENVDGEGAPFDLARVRARTFRRFGMCVAESSPGRDVLDPRWIGSTKHEAEPTSGILSLYNRGDRRRWYWKCPHCFEPFEPDFKHLDYPDEGDDVFRAENAVMNCPHCYVPIKHQQKYQLNLTGRWIKDGQRWNKDGTITGAPLRSDIASFWLKGVAAAFADWSELVMKYIKASDEFDKTGSEEALRATVNADRGEPYTPKALEAARLPEELKNRAEDWGGTQRDPVVPDGVRYLVATVDVQKHAFVCHVHGFGVGGDVWLVDMFKIRKSERVDESGDHELIDPAAYPEDWNLLIDQVIRKTYPLADDSGRHMQIKLTGCDSGGREGVTTNAYGFWRHLRDAEGLAGQSLHNRFQLLKGEPSKTAPRYKRYFPDAQKKDRMAASRGDVPVGFINSNLQKDTVFAMLGRTEPNGGMIHFPVWAEDWLYMQLTAEVRTPKGWENTGSKRNESFDLLYYAVSLGLDARIKAETIDWDEPPGWANVWDKNDMVISGPDKAGFSGKRSRRSLKELGESMA